MQQVSRLIEIMKRLRDPEGGCPWDREQVLASILPYTFEELYELAEAIDGDDSDAIRDELGDLLFHVVFYARIGEEAGRFDLSAVAGAIADKLERRHPHVFGDAEMPDSAGQERAWERLKAAERGDTPTGAVLAGISHAQPALIRAMKLQRRAATVGFDWPVIEPVLEKLEEEVAELREAVLAGAGPQATGSELGDILFAAVNCARHLGIDPETALRQCNARFEQRFARVEDELRRRGRSVEEATLEEMEDCWQLAKSVPGDP